VLSQSLARRRSNRDVRFTPEKRTFAHAIRMSALGHKRSFFKHLVGGMEDETTAVDRQMSSPFEHLDSKNRWQVTGDLLPTLTFVEAREDRATVCAEIDSRWIAFVTSHRLTKHIEETTLLRQTLAHRLPALPAVA
jgi:hypothetical protein